MIIFENNETTFNANSVVLKSENIMGKVYAVAVAQFEAESLDAVKEAFTNGGTWSIVADELTEAYTDYPILCRLVDRCDGSVMVYMRKKTDAELLEEENAALFFQLLTGEEFV